MGQPDSGIRPRGIKKNMVNVSMALFACAAILSALNVGDASSSANRSSGTSQIVRDGRIAMQKDVVIIKFAATAALSKSMLRTANPSLHKLFQKHGVTSYESAYSIPEFSLIPESQDLQRIYYLYYQSGENPRQVAAKLSRHRDIEYAVPKYYHRINDDPSISQAQIDNLLGTIPNDSLFSQMTHLNLIRAPEAWDVVKGDTGGVVIAIVDGGTDWHHEDLFDNIWTNPGEIPDNGVDDDGNGFIDDVHGWNFAEGGGDPTGLVATPLNAAHGTAVAGVASAVTNNLIGISGVSWNAQVMPVNSSCAADSFICYGYDGMLYAALSGADIINASWGSAYEQLTAFEERELLSFTDDIISFVTANGAIVVSSAGNDIANADEILSLPGGDPHVLAVGATMKASDQLAWFSNYGVSVDVFAPGIFIESTIPENAYTMGASGTSFSSPLVAGAAALVKTRFPHFSPDQLAAQVRITADAIDYANPELAGLLGRGRINTYEAVTTTNSPAVRIVNASFRESGQDGIIDGGDTVVVSVNLTNHLATVANLSLQLENDDPDVEILISAATISSLPTGDTSGVDFQFVLDPSVYEERTLRFIVAMNSGSYHDRDLLRVYANEPIIVTHDTGVLQVSLTSEGNIGWTGFADASPGDGFIYNGTNLLFEGGLLVGVSSDQVSDCIRGIDELLEQDFRLQEGSDVLLTSGDVAAEEGKVTLIDDRADQPLGIVIQQRSYADNQSGKDEFIIFSYSITNASDHPLSDLYIGQFFDWDLRADALDYARFDSQRNMGYVMNSHTYPSTLVATYLLNHQDNLTYRAIDNPDEIYGGDSGDGFTPREKWTFLSGHFQNQTLEATDVSTITGAGPFYLPPNESIRIAFAVVAAEGVTEVKSNADQALALWDNTIHPHELLEGVTTYYLSQNFSNPFSPVKEASTTILYSLIKPSNVRLAVFDLLGREVRVLDSGFKEDNEHTVRWNGKDNLGKLVSSGIYIYRLEVDGQTFSRKLVVLK
jgi:hypothetical protein